MKALYGSALFAIAMTTGTMAADAGWGVQFHYDAFEDKTYPMAMMREAAEGMAFDSANLFMACKDGAIAVIFQPERLSFNTGATIGKFRGADGVHEFQFNVGSLPAFGRNRVIEGAAAAKLIEIFTNASAAVPYQTETKQGNFPVVGFDQVHTIMTTHCAEL